MIGTNLNGVFHCCRAAIPALRARGGGWIINISSLASTQPFAGGAAYCATKAAVKAFSDAHDAGSTERQHPRELRAARVDGDRLRRHGARGRTGSSRLKTSPARSIDLIALPAAQPAEPARAAPVAAGGEVATKAAGDRAGRALQHPRAAGRRRARRRLPRPRHEDRPHGGADAAARTSRIRRAAARPLRRGRAGRDDPQPPQHRGALRRHRRGRPLLPGVRVRRRTVAASGDVGRSSGRQAGGGARRADRRRARRRAFARHRAR